MAPLVPSLCRLSLLLCAAAAGASFASPSCAALGGVWTGFVSRVPLYDEYYLAFEAGAAPGAFSAVNVRASEPGGWTIGAGQLSPDNSTVTIAFDTGVTLRGNVSADCALLEWENGSQWKETGGIEVVHLLSMSHIDVGYHIGDSPFARIIEVLQAYVDVFFPRAIAIARALRDLGGSERLIYTSHSWLLSLYLHCPANLTLSGETLRCPTPGAVAELTAALQAGDIYFHAGAFNLQYEHAMNAEVVDFSLQLARDLADELGVARPSVLSLRDVPGTTRSLVPILARNNITALSIGVNDAAPNAAMPNPGVWQDPATNASVLYMQTGPGICYPWPPGPDPLHPGGLGVPSCVTLPGLRHAMCWVFRIDNAGPPESVEEVLSAFSIARWQFPGAQVWASTFENFTQHLAGARSALPVTTSEAGDNWIQSTAADPYKMAWFREAARALADCVAEGACSDTRDPRLFGFLRMLIKTPEHTYGTPRMYDESNWSNAAFHAAIAARAPAYTDALSTYTEQRDVVAREGLRYLADHPLAARLAARLAALAPAPPATGALVPLPPAAWATPILTAGGATLALDAATGALAGLTLGGIAWADAAHTLGLLSYRTFDDAALGSQGAFCCWGAAGRQAAARPNATRSAPALRAVWLDSAAAPSQVTALLGFDAALVAEYGAPGQVYLRYTVVGAGAGASVQVELQVFNKTATRLAEACLLDFVPSPSAAAGLAWSMDKLGGAVDPLQAVAGGSPHQHSVARGVLLAAAGGGSGGGSGAWLALDTLDAGVVSPITATSGSTNFIVPFEPLQGPVLGFGALLWQNAFNTNTPLFTFDDAYKWRFVLRAGGGAAAAAAA